MAAAGLGLRKSGKSRAKSSNQGWSPNSGQAAQDESGSFVDVLVSEQGQHSSSSGFTDYLNNRISKLALRRSQLLQWISYRMVSFSPSLLGPTLSRLQRNALGQYQPAGNNETPLAREDPIVNAQLIRLISRDDAHQGQDAYHASDDPMHRCTYSACYQPLRDARLVEDAASGASVHSLPAGKRKCAACSMCGTRFTHGEARLQQWGNRQTNNHYVHAHCVNGGLGHDHELHPKVADDQEAVDAVTRQRDTITRKAADTEVLLPFAQDPDQASTAAPPDDERDLFGREEALRMDEEIMDFQWFEHVTWDSVKDSRGTTYVQPPARFRFALQQAQHAILRAIVHNNPTSACLRISLESAGAQQLAPLWDDLQSTPLRAIGRTFWMHDWSFFGLKIGLLSGPWYVLNVMLLQRRTRRAGRR